jgi:acyl-coenzyme A synthetase/AMP-(fatty) acid ligase
LPARQWAEEARRQKRRSGSDLPAASIEAVVAMQACARIGAIHSVVFGGFSAKSVQERISDAGACVVITADGQFRGGKEIPP